MIKTFLPITISSALGFQCFNSALDLLDIVPAPPGKYSSDERFRWRNAATSLFSSSVIACLVVFCLLNHPELWIEPEMYHTAAGEVFFAIICGYLMYDTRDLMTYSRFSRVWSVVIHHVILFVSLVILSWEKRAMGVLTIGLLSEVSAIFLHSRQLLLMYGFSKRSLVYAVHRMGNLATFIPLRLIPLFYAVYHSYISRNMPVYISYTLPFLTTSIFVINLVLLWRLICSDFLRTDNKDSHVMDN